ncbi:MAG: hypothetical protein HKN18_13890 [Silicimonas sp.]|nr:hypothetical protein [Silicimonas sp.]
MVDVMRLLCLFSLVAFPALAQEGIRDSDTLLNATEMNDLLAGQLIEFYDGSKSSYSADGTYGYTYTDNGPVWSGQYSLFDESRVCVDFDNGSRRCDHFVQDGARVVLVTEDGLRFPIRNRSVYQR